MMDAQDNDGLTALAVSCRRGDFATASLLLNGGASITKATKLGNTPLMWAAQAGSLECVRALLELKARPNLKNSGGQTALMWACYGGHVAVVRELLKYKADPKIRSSEGITALMCCAISDSAECAELLLKSADAIDLLLQQDFCGRSTIHFAAENLSYSILQLILNQGADPFAVDNAGISPLTVLKLKLNSCDPSEKGQVEKCLCFLKDRMVRLQKNYESNLSELLKIAGDAPSSAKSKKKTKKKKGGKSGDSDQRNNVGELESNDDPSLILEANPDFFLAMEPDTSRHLENDCNHSDSPSVEDDYCTSSGLKDQTAPDDLSFYLTPRQEEFSERESRTYDFHHGSIESLRRAERILHDSSENNSPHSEDDYCHHECGPENDCYVNHVSETYNVESSCGEHCQCQEEPSEPATALSLLAAPSIISESISQNNSPSEFGTESQLESKESELTSVAARISSPVIAPPTRVLSPTFASTSSKGFYSNALDDFRLDGRDEDKSSDDLLRGSEEVLYKEYPEAEALSISVRNLLGLDLEDSSLEQLDCIEHILRKSMRSLKDVKQARQTAINVKLESKIVELSRKIEMLERLVDL